MRKILVVDDEEKIRAIIRNMESSKDIALLRLRMVWRL